MRRLKKSTSGLIFNLFISFINNCFNCKKKIKSKHEQLKTVKHYLYKTFSCSVSDAIVSRSSVKVFISGTLRSFFISFKNPSTFPSKANLGKSQVNRIQIYKVHVELQFSYRFSERSSSVSAIKLLVSTLSVRRLGNFVD